MVSNTSCDKISHSTYQAKHSLKSNTRSSSVPQVPRLPNKVKVDVTKRHTCRTKWRSMSPSATPATQSEGWCLQVPRLHMPATQTAAATTASNGTQACHQSQPSAISATPATQSEGRCRQVPCLPHKVKVDVTKCNACHTQWRSMSARCLQVPRLHMPATQTAAATTASNGTHACHQSQPSAISATPATQSEGRCFQVPCLPHKMKVDVTKCNACHTQGRSMSARCLQVPRLHMPATQTAAATTGPMHATRASPVQ